jgi:hypothetical protein
MATGQGGNKTRAKASDVEALYRDVMYTAVAEAFSKTPQTADKS